MPYSRCCRPLQQNTCAQSALAPRVFKLCASDGVGEGVMDPQVVAHLGRRHAVASRDRSVTQPEPSFLGVHPPSFQRRAVARQKRARTRRRLAPGPQRPAELHTEARPTVVWELHGLRSHWFLEPNRNAIGVSSVAFCL